jgi:hypothetical protein
MKLYYQIFYRNKLFKVWSPHNFDKYSSLQSAQKEINSYKEHKLGVKFRIVKTEILYEDKK